MCENTILLPILSAVKKMMTLIQFIVPILLICFATFKFIMMIKNPDEKGGTKKILNQFLAAAIVFFIPLIINILIAIVGEKTQFSSCWVKAEDYKISTSKFYEIGNNKRKKITTDTSKYEPGEGRSPYDCLKKNKTTSLVFIGNSKTYVHNIPKKVQAIAKSNGYSVQIKSVVEGGNTLSELSYKYSSSISASYDCAILQEQTDVYMADYNTYSSGASNVISQLRNANPNVKIYIRALWVTSSSGSATRNNSYSYTESIASNNQATVIYDGKAFDKCRSTYPSIGLFGDDIHQSEAGAYLSAATIFKALSGMSPQKTTYIAGLSETTARQLLKIADET